MRARCAFFPHARTPMIGYVYFYYVYYIYSDVYYVYSDATNGINMLFYTSTTFTMSTTSTRRWTG